jgi:hypothetical protein
MSQQRQQFALGSFHSPRVVRQTGRPLQRRLCFEPLEERRLLAITVNTLIDTNANDGLTTLREAVTAAPAGETINFSVTGTINLSSLGQITINKNLTINGPGANLLTINAYDPTPASNNNDGQRIFNIDDSTATVRTVSINGLTLTGGDVNGGGGAIRNAENLTLSSSTVTGNAAWIGVGGGLYNGGATAVMNVNGCTISNNVSAFGGGLFNLSGNLNVNNSTISGNGVTGNGGGIQNNFGTLNVTGSTISGNNGLAAGGGINTYFDIATNVTDTTIRGNNADKGGGIWSHESTLTITASTISGNTAQKGGGVYQLNDTLNLVNSTLHRNTASDSGGGIFSNGGTANLQNSAVSYNSAAISAGGIEKRSGALTITNSWVHENRSTKYGGGIWAFSCTTTITSSTISGNSVDENAGWTTGSGGGILQTYGTMTLASSTISGNSTTNNGGGIYTYLGTLTARHCTIANNLCDTAFAGSPVGVGGGIINSGSTLNIDHTIVAGNQRSPVFGSPEDDISGPVTARFSLIGSNLGATITNNGGNLIGTNAAPINPLLGSLLEQGGTPTHALLAGSPAIDAGDPAAVPGSGTVPVNDQRGAPFLRKSGARIDIGAYEKQTIATTNFTVDTLLDEVDGNYAAGDLSLREAIGLASGGGTAAQTIGFAPALYATGPAKISLIRGELRVNSSLSIYGPGADLMTIDGSRNNPTSVAGDGANVFEINNNATNNVTISGLTISGADSANGGGINSFANLTVSGCTITNNFGGLGGGIQNSNGTLTVSFCLISNNTGGDGGGIYNSATLIVDSSTISGNIIDDEGGGIRNTGNMTVTNSTISGNTAEDGAGIHNYFNISSGLTATIVNSTISGNTAVIDPNDPDGDANGGGIYIDAGLLILRNCTITNNTAPTGFGSGVLAKANNTRVEVTNTIIAANTNTNVDIVEGATNSFLSHGYNLIGNGSALAAFNQAGDQTNVTNPKLGPLAVNGGPTQTHSLLTTSPAIDLGDPTAVAGSGNIPLYDQRGATFGRVYNGDGVGGARIDIGAYESQPIPPAVFGDYSHNNVADAADFVLWRKTLFNEGPAYSGADGNGSGQVDQGDYTVWRSQLGRPVSATGAESGVAEQLGADSGTAQPVATTETTPQAPALSVVDSAAALPAVVPSPEIADLDFDQRVSNRSPVNLPSASSVASLRLADDALVAWLGSCECDHRQDDHAEIEPLHDFAPADEEPNVLSDPLDAIFASLAP